MTTKTRANIELIIFRLDEINKKLDGVITKVDCHDRDIVEVKNNIRIFNSFQTWLTVLGSALATAIAWLISKKQ